MTWGAPGQADGVNKTRARNGALILHAHAQDDNTR